MKAINEEFRYDQDVEAVFSLVSQGAFQVELLTHLGGKDAAVLEETRDGGRVHLVTSQRTAVELPGFAKKLVPANTTVVQTFDWDAAADGRRQGTWSAVIKGAPISIGGPTELVPDGEGSRHRFLGQIRASVPLVGGKLEGFAYDNLRRDLARGEAFTADRLAVGAGG
jgi:hypothetical protein